MSRSDDVPSPPVRARKSNGPSVAGIKTAIGQALVVCERTLLLFLRARRTFVLDNLLMFLVGLLIASLYTEVKPDGNAVALFQMIQLAISFPSLMIGLRTFGSDKEIWARESESGLSLASYFGGKQLGSAFAIFIPPVTFLTGWYLRLHPRAPFSDYLSLVLLHQFALAGTAALISVLFGRKGMSFVGCFVLLIFMLSNGLDPRKQRLEDQLGTFGDVLLAISFLRFTAEGLAAVEFRSYPACFAADIETWLLPSEWSLAAFPTFVLFGLFVHGLVTLTLTLAHLFLDHRYDLQARCMAACRRPVRLLLARFSLVLKGLPSWL